MGEFVFLSLLFSITFNIFCRGDSGDYLGCYRLGSSEDIIDFHTGESVDVCLVSCKQEYYKFAIIGNGSKCFCGNKPGNFKFPLETCNTPCPKNETQKCGAEGAGSVYDTEVMSPGPPAAAHAGRVTETTLRLNWTAPRAHTTITGYILRASPIETYAESNIEPLDWKVSNSTFYCELQNLYPGSTYVISIAAINDDYEGPNITVRAVTVIGTPDPSPPDIKVVERHGDKMLVHIPKAKNVNGPVSMYRVVVSIELYQQGFLAENLGNYSFAEDQGLPYYITAELDPEDIKTDFIIGDGRTYNGFYNAPLQLISDISVSLGIVSEKGNVRKVRYAESTKKIILNINEPEEFSPMMVALGAGIAIGVVLLLIGVGMIIVLRKKFQTVRVQRGSQSMPLSLSEPCLEIENAGFLQDEDLRIDYYGNLKRQLWNIPRNLLDIDISCTVGVGTYGKFTKGKVQQHGSITMGLVQVILDRDLDKMDRKAMLQELDALIKTSEHENVISLIGICETNTSLLVVLEDTQGSLKELLLQSRRMDEQNNKFSSLGEGRVLQLCADVARGLDYLHSKKIAHGRLCCRHVELTGGAARVAGFGLAVRHAADAAPCLARWAAPEAAEGGSAAADVWALGVTLWEAATLGGTPYARVAGAAAAARVARGARLPQPPHVAAPLFALCLQSWAGRSERPSAAAVLRALGPLCDSPAAALSFTLYDNFQYEPYVPEYEVLA